MRKIDASIQYTIYTRHLSHYVSRQGKSVLNILIFSYDIDCLIIRSLFAVLKKLAQVHFPH